MKNIKTQIFAITFSIFAITSTSYAFLFQGNTIVDSNSICSQAGVRQLYGGTELYKLESLSLDSHTTTSGGMVLLIGSFSMTKETTFSFYAQQNGVTRLYQVPHNKVYVMYGEDKIAVRCKSTSDNRDFDEWVFIVPQTTIGNLVDIGIDNTNI